MCDGFCMFRNDWRQEFLLSRKQKWISENCCNAIRRTLSWFYTCPHSSHSSRLYNKNNWAQIKWWVTVAVYRVYMNSQSDRSAEHMTIEKNLRRMALKLAHISVAVSNMYTKYTHATHNEYENKKFVWDYTQYTQTKKKQETRSEAKKRKKKTSFKSIVYVFLRTSNRCGLSEVCNPFSKKENIRVQCTSTSSLCINFALL